MVWNFFATRLDGAPVIPGGLVISRLLEGLAKLGKRPDLRKLGINSALVRRMVAELCSMGLRPISVGYGERYFVARAKRARRVQVKLAGKRSSSRRFVV